jgi:hypothetical protein
MCESGDKPPWLPVNMPALILGEGGTGNHQNLLENEASDMNSVPLQETYEIVTTLALQASRLQDHFYVL